MEKSEKLQLNIDKILVLCAASSFKKGASRKKKFYQML